MVNINKIFDRRKNMRKCRFCKEYFDNTISKSKITCDKCYDEYPKKMSERKTHLQMLQSLPLEAKIAKSKKIIEDALLEYGDNIAVSYSGGKDSTVLSHLVRQIKPDILHIFSNTTCEYPDTLKHIKWEKEENGMNLVVARPYDDVGRPYGFKRVVGDYGYPAFSKAVGNAIYKYRNATNENSKKNYLEFIKAKFPRYEKYKNMNIANKCCDKLKKEPLKKIKKEYNIQCSFIGTLAEESHWRESSWINYGCNAFESSEPKSRPLSFWREQDVLEYIQLYDLKIPDLYKKGFKRNGCMFCAFGINFEKDRFLKLKEAYPKSHKFLEDNFGDLLDSLDIQY